MKAFVTEIYVDIGAGLTLQSVKPSTALDIEDLRLALCEGARLPKVDVPVLLITREHHNYLQHKTEEERSEK